MNDSIENFRKAILAEIGFAPNLIEPGKFLRFATSNHGDDTEGWCRLFDDQRGGVFGCDRRQIVNYWIYAEEATLPRPQRRKLLRDALQTLAEHTRQKRMRGNMLALREA